MSGSPEYSREDFARGGLNDQLDADSLVKEIGLDRSEIRWRKDFIGFTDDDVRRLRTYRDDFADNADQAAAAEEIASMVDEVVDRTDSVAEEIESLAAANEEQAAMVSEVEEPVTRLSGERSATDGGQEIVTTTDSEQVSIPQDLPDDMPDFVIETLSEEQLREVAIGNRDPTDLL